MLLSIEQLEVSYGHILAVRGVSLEVEEAEVVAVMGSNGAGKSTTIKALCGLVKPQAGKICLAGREITRLPAERITQAGIGYVPEGRRVFGQMSVRENLLVGAYARRRAKTLKQEEQQIYDYFPALADKQKRLAGTLSGGEQQMVALGRALMSRPRLLVLDEPSLGLAPLIVKQVFALLQRLNREQGLAILLVEQNMQAALRIARQGVVLETGQVRLRGSARALWENPLVQEIYLGSQGESAGGPRETFQEPSSNSNGNATLPASERQKLP